MSVTASNNSGISVSSVRSLRIIHALEAQHPKDGALHYPAVPAQVVPVLDSAPGDAYLDAVSLG